VQPKLRHLLLTTIEDASNPKSWSGIPFSLREALERKVERLTVFKPGPTSRNPIDVAKKLWYGGKPPKYPLWMTAASLKKNARELEAEISRINPDAILGILAQPLVYLKNPGKPVFFFADSAFQSFKDKYKGTIGENIRNAEYARDEADVARRIDGVCLGSKWACEDAVRVFSNEFPGVDFASRLHVTPLGANWRPELSREAVLARAAERGWDEIRLLYLGVDWVRKGGPLAVEVACGLRDAGYKVRLDVVGCRPELPADAMDVVTVHGALYRTDPAQAEVLQELFLRSHFLVVPTMAECYGIVFAEAHAFALPPVSRAVDALPTIIVDGETGLLQDASAPASVYIERILKLRDDPAAYLRMATKARDRYENLLNWDKCAEEIVRLMEEKLAE
jgi:glycosyltransferase involved in cell wall biosynthesis